MAREFDFTGESGTVYRYFAQDDERPPSPAGGNYLYVKTGEAGPEVVYAGETESLYRGLRDAWGEAREQYGATGIYTRLNITGHVRRAEQADIVAHYRPVMNAGQ